MAKRANPAHHANKLQSLLAIMFLIIFTAIPMTCTAATMPMQPAAQIMQQDCSPCCHHSAPATAQLACCDMQQDQAPARIASGPIVSLEATPIRHMTRLEPATIATFNTTLPTKTFSPPSSRIPLRI